MTTQEKTLAVLSDKPANPATNPIVRPLIGVQQFMLLNANEHMCIPLFLQRNSGAIQYFYLMKAMLPNVETNESQRILQTCWLLIPANPQVSGDSNKLYFADRNHGHIHMHNKMIALKGNSAFNSLIATVTLRNMPLIPNKLAELKWKDKIWPVLNKHHDMLCGTQETEPLEKKSEEFDKFLKDGNKNSNDLLIALFKAGKLESNTVFEVLPDTISMNKTLFYGDNYTSNIIENQHNGINKPMCISSWNGVFRGNTEVTSTTNGLGQQLTHGLREIGEGNKKKYSVDMVGKVFDRMANATEGRLTCIDPVTIAYLNNNTNAKDNNAATESSKKSRANVLYDVFHQNEHIQVNNAEMRLHANGTDNTSAKISWELRLTDQSTYLGLKDISKLGSVNSNADESLLDLLLSGEDISDEIKSIEDEIDYDAVLNETNDLAKEVNTSNSNKKDKKSKESTEMLNIKDELPF